MDSVPPTGGSSSGGVDGSNNNGPPPQESRQNQAGSVGAEPNEANPVRNPQLHLALTSTARSQAHRARRWQAKHPKKAMTANERQQKKREIQNLAKQQQSTAGASATAAPVLASSAPSTTDVTPVPGNPSTVHGSHPHRPVVTRSAPQPNANASAAQPAVHRADAVATASRLASDVPTPAAGVALPAARSRGRVDVRHEAGVRDPSHSPLRQSNLAHERGVRDPSHSPVRPMILPPERPFAEADAGPVSSRIPGRAADADVAPPTADADVAPPTADADVAPPRFRGIRHHPALPPCAPSIVRMYCAAPDFIKALEPWNAPVTTALVDIAHALDQESTVPVDLSRLEQAITARLPDVASMHREPRRFFRKVREIIDDELLELTHPRPLPTEMFDMDVEVDRKCRCGTQRRVQQLKIFVPLTSSVGSSKDPIRNRLEQDHEYCFGCRSEATLETFTVTKEYMLLSMDRYALVSSHPQQRKVHKSHALQAAEVLDGTVYKLKSSVHDQGNNAVAARHSTFAPRSLPDGNETWVHFCDEVILPYESQESFISTPLAAETWYFALYEATDAPSGGDDVDSASEASREPRRLLPRPAHSPSKGSHRKRNHRKRHPARSSPQTSKSPRKQKKQRPNQQSTPPSSPPSSSSKRRKRRQQQATPTSSSSRNRKKQKRRPQQQQQQSSPTASSPPRGRSLDRGEPAPRRRLMSDLPPPRAPRSEGVSEEQKRLNELRLDEVVDQVGTGVLKPDDIPDDAFKNHRRTKNLQARFHGSQKRLCESIYHCPCCHRRFFALKPKVVNGGKAWCVKCVKDKEKFGIPRFGTANNMNPYPRGYPFHLPKLTTIEQMLIARIHVVMRAYRLQNGSLGYRGHVVNVEQEVQDVADQIRNLSRTKLALRLGDLPVVIVKKPSTNAPGGYKDFKVRREAIRKWLVHLKRNCSYYRDLQINYEALNELPDSEEGECVADRIRVLVEPDPPSQDNDEADDMANSSTQGDAPADDNANEDAATADAAVPGANAHDGSPEDLDDDDDMDPADQQHMGPEQGGATGIPHAERPVKDIYLAPPPDRSTPEDRDRRILEFLGAPGIDWPRTGGLVNEYTCPGLQAMCFPTLFPYGVGDCTKKDRHTFVSMADSNAFLLQYCIWDKKEKRFFYPFAEHDRFGHWAQNVVERHRANGQRSYWLRQSDEFGNLTYEQLDAIIQENGDRLKRLIGQMQQFNANINGSHAQMFKHRKNLEAIIMALGPPTFFVSFSAADNHWIELFRCLTYGSPRAIAVPANEEKAALQRRTLNRLHEHLVGAYFKLRIESLFDVVFRDGLGCKWDWFRLELQERGRWHCHGCLRLKGDPDLTEKARAVVRGRDAQRALQKFYPNATLERTFDADVTKDDQWHKNHVPGSCCTEGLSDDEMPMKEDDEGWIKLYKAKLEEGIDAHNVLVAFQKLFLTTMHPDPPADATQRHRLEETFFAQGPYNKHPSAVDPLQRAPDDHEPALVNATQRHAHNSYCQDKKRKPNPNQDSDANANGEPAPKRRRCRKTAAEISKEGTKKACRFSFPIEASSTTCLVVKQTFSNKNGLQIQVEIKSKRNDGWLNGYSSPILLMWKANFDMRLTVDMGKIVGYMTKYVTKTETSDPTTILRVFQAALNTARAEGRTPEYALKKAMSTLLGVRTRPKTEIFHLMMKGEIVRCSHKFSSVNLNNDLRRMLLAAGAEAGDGESPDEAEDEEAVGQGTGGAPGTDAAAPDDDDDDMIEDPYDDPEMEFDEPDDPEMDPADPETEEADEGVAVEVATAGAPSRRTRRVRGDGAATKMTLLDAYGCRLDREAWGSPEAFAEHGENNLREMSLFEFCRDHHVGDRGPLRNKILVSAQTRKKIVVSFYPAYRRLPDHPDYPKYCRMALIKHKPWVGTPGSIVPDDGNMVELWQAFLEHRRRAKMPIAGLLDRDVQRTLAAMEQHRGRGRRTGFDAGADSDDDDDDDTGDGDVGADDDYVARPLGASEEWSGETDEIHAGLLNAAPDGQVGIRWDHTHTPVQSEFVEIREHLRDDAPEVFEGLRKASEPHEAPANGPPIQLNRKQQLAHDLIVALADRKPVEGGGPTGKCVILSGKGGTGKTTVINAITRTLKSKYGNCVSVRKLAPTGKAADNIQGSTVYNKENGLALPISGKKYVPFKEGNALDARRAKWKHIRVVFIDEFSMLRQHELYLIDQRLRELFRSDLPFGGVVVVLSGDTGQIPPVGGRVLWDSKKSATPEEQLGYHMYMYHFEHCVILDENNRVENDENAKAHVEIIDKLRDGKNSKPEWESVCRTCFRDTMGETEWARRFPAGNPSITYLFTTNKEVDEHNLRQLTALGAPILKVDALHSDGAASAPSGDMGLEKRCFLAEGAKVYLTSNVGTEVGLCNGTVGVIKKIVYKEGTDPPGLPEFVLVDFGESYRGESFFPDKPEWKGWVPVYPFTARSDKRPSLTRTMIPLRLAFAWTVWKSQGQTYRGKVVFHIPEFEPQHGITYVAFSRVTKLENLGIEGAFTLTRFTDIVRNHKLVAPRQAEERRLARLAVKSERYIRQVLRGRRR